MSENTKRISEEIDDFSLNLDRVMSVEDEKVFAKAIMGDLQGIFLYQHDKYLDLFSFDLETHQLSGLMSQADLTKPLKLVLPYEQAMIISVFCQDNEPQSAYFAGIGGARLPLFVQKHFKDCVIDGSDIDPNMLRVAEKCFGFTQCEQCNVVAGDSRADLQSRNTKYDVIFIDVYSGGGEAVDHLGTLEFFELCKSKLNADGIVVANLVTIDPKHMNKIAALKACFEHCTIWEHEESRMLYASQNPIQLDTIRKRVISFEKKYNSDSSIAKQASKIQHLNSTETHSYLLDRNIT